MGAHSYFMGRVFGFLAFLFVLLAGCSEFTLYPEVEESPGADNAPNIVVTPQEIDFGALNADGDSAVETVVVANTGTETLYIDEIELDIASNVFSITVLDSDEIQPNESASFAVTYDPQTYEENENKITIWSNDPKQLESYVLIEGMGDAPVINIDPSEYIFRNTLVGCENTVEVTISNVGNVDLIIDRIDYYITYPADLGIDNYESAYGPLPWVLAPNESVLVEIFYQPTDVDVDYGSIEVFSNDPATPTAIADQEANGVYDSVYEEVFIQEILESIDILFVIDNSCSMGDKQTQLSNNFYTFMNVLYSSGIDYQMGFITTDDPTMVGSMISYSTADPIGDVTQIIDTIGIGGSPTEKGMEHAYEALQTTGEFGPGTTFWRNNSKLIIIFVSDEDDASAITPADFQNYVVSVKGGADYVTAHAVAGDYPGGCSTNGGASPGTDYDAVVSLLNGTFLSICQDDWGTPLETLAQTSILKSSFTLAKDAVEDTIYVELDGVETTEWSYDSSTSAISFNDGSIPEHGATIYVSYNPSSECPTGRRPT